MLLCVIIIALASLIFHAHMNNLSKSEFHSPPCARCGHNKGQISALCNGML